MKIKVIILSTLVFISFISCGPRHFRTKSIYKAIQTGYKLDILSSGEIKFGDDLSNIGKSEVKVLSLENEKPELLIEIKRFPQKLEVTVNNLEKHSIVQSTNLKSTLSDQLQANGYKINNDELDETVRAIFGTASGPKGTLMDGQTKFLEVVKIQFDYN